jgi:hypothetical protein
MDDFLALPPFRPEEALVQLKRSLRELRPLVERGDGFELQGQPVLRLAAEGSAIRAGLVRRPARSPEWDERTLADAAQVRDFTDEVRRRLARWSDE